MKQITSHNLRFHELEIFIKLYIQFKETLLLLIKWEIFYGNTTRTFKNYCGQ
jgi:hypothetical protein